jgi:hypothetical protein
MGIVQLGVFNTKAKVISSIPLSTQFTNILNALIDNSAKKGELLLQLRQFNFAEITGAMSEKGYCYLKAELYSKEDDFYKKISSIDTVILVKSMDVTKPLFRNGSKIITDFISNNLIKNATDLNYYTMNNIVNIDSIEKKKLNVYCTSTYSDGLYFTFNSFTKQKPDKQITVEMKGEKISQVKTIDEKGNSDKIRTKDIYAIVYKGKPYISSEYGYFPLIFRNDDFYFIGKSKETANSGEVIAAGMFFGIIGSLVASNNNAIFEMKIDHTNGGFIRIKEIED